MIPSIKCTYVLNQIEASFYDWLFNVSPLAALPRKPVEGQGADV